MTSDAKSPRCKRSIWAAKTDGQRLSSQDFFAMEKRTDLRQKTYSYQTEPENKNVESDILGKQRILSFFLFIFIYSFFFLKDSYIYKYLFTTRMKSVHFKMYSNPQKCMHLNTPECATTSAICPPDVIPWHGKSMQYEMKVTENHS